MVSLIAVLAVANSLRSVDGENPEYDRALVELTSSIMPGDADIARELVHAIVLERALDAPVALVSPEPLSSRRHRNAVG